MRGFLIGLILILSITASAQVDPANIKALRRSEDSMKTYAHKMISERMALQRFLADSMFIRMLVRALKTPNSFYYPFDSLETVSRLYAPDSSFRIFSWQFTRDENYFRQRGAIQVRTNDGSLKLFPLVDMSDFTQEPQDSVRTGNNWIGSIYYGIVMKMYNDKKYYTLLGFDDHNMKSSRKYIEVMTFDANGKPVFGGPFFSIPDGTLRTTGSKQARFVLEYKKEGRARMNYDKELDMIVFDHLISEDNKPDVPYTYVPDGDYQGFKWVNGRWVLVDKVFNYKLQDGQAPIPNPLKDASGKNNELKLMQQSEQNRLRQKQLAQPPVKKQTVPVLPPVKKDRQPAKEKEESY